MMNRTRAILRCLVLLLFWLFSLHAISQVNLQAEYFIDSDPGYGLGFPINFTNASTIDSLEFNLNTTNLQSGYHTLYVRSQDNNGNWSLCNSVTFFKEKNFETNPLSQNAEFFIDIDPGIGQGQSISLPQGLQTAYKAFVINTATMSPGFHKLFVRGKDNKGNWGNCSYNVFYVDPFSDGLHNIAALEYFTDNDPGIGNAIPISISGNTADTSIVLPYNQTLFNKGFHRLYLRSFDSTGRSSLTNTTAFYVECLDTSLSQLKDAEYYFDTDPGFSQANFLGTIQNFNDSINTTISIASLQPGWHRLNIRARDHNNFWTHNLAYSFYKEILDTGLAAYEFFFDTDPGFSNADYGLFTPSNANDSAVFSLPVANLNNGFHNFFVRSKNNLGKWGVTSFTSFYKAPINQPLALISQSEYFIDTDPGFNNGTSVGFTHDSIVADYSTVLNTSGQEPGFHSLNFRFKDENGLWGHTNNLSFYIEATDTAINQSAEFFIDSDPGFGAANPVIANLISTNDSALFVVDASVFSIGSHNLFVRSKNSLGLWGLTNTDLFCRGTDADFIADSACFGDMTLFVNSTFGADTATVYQWDINNNGTVDFTTNDSVYYAFGQPGTHLVMLISDNPGACGDTILKEVFVRELPVPFIGNDTTICAHESHIFNAGNQWASYVWSNGSTTPQISVNTPGN